MDRSLDKGVKRLREEYRAPKLKKTAPRTEAGPNISQETGLSGSLGGRQPTRGGFMDSGPQWGV